MFDEFEYFEKLRSAWNHVRIERSVEYSLFTFGDSDLPYYLVTSSDSDKEKLVRIRKGNVTISRARIITLDSMTPEFQNFFDNEEDLQLVEFLMARSAAFGNMRIVNENGPDRIVTDTIEEAVARLNRQLDDEDEDRVAILSAPAELAGFAVFRYATQKILQSAPGNIQELREKGLLP